MLPDTEIQKEMSEAYLRAVVFRAGFDLYEPKNDRGIDGTIGDPNRRGRGVDRIDYQLKSTTRYEIRDANIIYDLRVENYNQLVIETDVPRVLILYLMPSDSDQWLSHSVDELILRKCAYWVSLMGMLPSRNSSTQRVEAPLANIFSHDELPGMLHSLVN